MAKKRRADGEGSICWSDYEQTWIAQITLPDGKRRRKRSKKQEVVKKWLFEQRKRINENRVLKDENLTTGKYLDHFIKTVASHTLRASTLRSYKYLIRDHVKPAIGHVKLASLRPDHLETLYSDKLEEGLSRRTVQYIHSVIRRALNHAVKQELIYRNPTDAVTPPRPKKRVPQTLTEDQVERLFEQTKGHPYYPIYVIAVTMGLRKSEILGLRWKDIDFEQGTISINHIVSEIQGKIVTGAPKTASSRRTVPMPAFVIDTLKKVQQVEGESDGLIFATSTGRPLSQRNVTRHFHKALENAGLPKIRFHDLRHTAATLLLKENVHPKVVQEMLGHSSIALTLDTYSHVLPGVGKKAADKMDELFG